VSSAKPPTGRKRIWNGKQEKLDYTADDDDLEEEVIVIFFLFAIFIVLDDDNSSSNNASKNAANTTHHYTKMISCLIDFFDLAPGFGLFNFSLAY
jgi:hypothetical protein